MRRLLCVLAVLSAVSLFSPAANTAWACPMCKTANETDDNRPTAYMYSILFMLAVPATLFSGIGFGLYRMNKNERAALQQQAEWEQSEWDGNEFAGGEADDHP